MRLKVVKILMMKKKMMLKIEVKKMVISQINLAQKMR